MRTTGMGMVKTHEADVATPQRFIEGLLQFVELTPLTTGNLEVAKIETVSLESCFLDSQTCCLGCLKSPLRKTRL